MELISRPHWGLNQLLHTGAAKAGYTAENHVSGGWVTLVVTHPDGTDLTTTEQDQLLTSLQENLNTSLPGVARIVRVSRDDRDVYGVVTRM